MAREDACIARNSGVDSIVVSNPRWPATRWSGLAHPRAAGDCGCRGGSDSGHDGWRGPTGADVLKVRLSVPYSSSSAVRFAYAAAIAGEAGVSHAILLSAEIYRNMGLLGVNSLGEMRPDRLLRLGGVDGGRT